MNSVGSLSPSARTTLTVEEKAFGIFQLPRRKSKGSNDTNSSTTSNDESVSSFSGDDINSGHDSITRNLKDIFRKTASFVSGTKQINTSNNLGPLTCAPLFETSKDHEDKIQVQNTSSCSSLEMLEKNYQEMKSGIWLTKVTRRKKMRYLFTVKDGIISWKDSRYVELDMIKDIRAGEMARNYREEYKISSSYSENWITIVYNVSNKLKALHVIASNHEDFKIFHSCVLNLVSSRRELMKSISVPDDEQFANLHWHANVSNKKEDESKDTLAFEDVKKLCIKFHIYCSNAHLYKYFTMADVNQNGLLNFKEFQLFVKLLKKRHEITKIWSSNIGGKGYMDFLHFFEFLTKTQGEKMNEKVAKRIFRKHVSVENPDALLEDGLLKYLSTQPYLKHIIEDYSQPLNNYFISSSHNTYLLGKQVGGNPTVEGYIQVLQQGCRCIEIDIWDGEDGPAVCHGMLTTSIPLKDVVEAIRKYAFITSPYPLIISLEIHCKRENQNSVMLIFKELLGEMIYIGDHHRELPSPLELKHKVVLKSKMSKNASAPVTGENSLYLSMSSSSSYESELELPEIRSRRKRGMRRLSLSKRVQVIESILLMSAIYGIKFRNFSLPESKTPTHCFSLDEKKFENLCKDENQKLSIDKHDRRHLMRIYPHAFRYKSSNFNPIKFWELGVQMVATNWQTYDLGQQINQAMFQIPFQRNSTWHSGYVLKPEHLLQNVQKTKDISSIYEKEKHKRIAVHIEILSAQLLPKPKESKEKDCSFAPYVCLRFICDKLIRPLHVSNGFAISGSEGSTKYCKDNGFNPVWETGFDITLRDTSFNFLSFTVKSGDVGIATCCLRLDYLKKGYRHIPLYSMEGERFIFSTLFIKIDYNSFTC